MPPSPMSSKIHLFAAVFLAVFSASALSAHPLDTDHTWGSQGIAAPVGEYGTTLRAGMALQEGRYPVIFYATRLPYTIRQVTWRNGDKLDELALSIPEEAFGIQVKTSGADVCLIYTLGQYGYSTTYFARQSGGIWGTPETVNTVGSSSGTALEIGSDGEPVVAMANSEYGYDNARVQLYRRNAGTWTPETVRTAGYRGISSMTLAITGGEEHLVFREYGQVTGDFDTNNIFHARKQDGVWTNTKIFDGFVEILFHGEDGILRMFGRSSSGSSPFYTQWDGSAWSALSATAPIGGGVRGAAVAKDGTIYATTLGDLIVRKDGVWSSVPFLGAQDIHVDSDGIPHTLESSMSALTYYTRVPNRWAATQVTPMNGEDLRLDGLGVDSTGRPHLFAYSFALSGSADYRRDTGLWQAIPFNAHYSDFEYLLGPKDKIHLFRGGSYYSGSIGSLQGEAVFSSAGWSSTSADSLTLDSAGNPHVSFVSYSSSTGYEIKYGVRKLGSWAVETVCPAGFFRHSGVAVDSSGRPHVLASGGLYRKEGSSWVLKLPVTGTMSYPTLVTSADGNIHGCWVNYNQLWALSGKDSSYQVEILGKTSSTPTRPAMAVFAGKPVVAYVSQEDYSTSRHSVRFAEKTGNYWRQENVTPISDDQEYGKKVKIAAGANGSVHVAAERSYQIGSTIFGSLVFHSREAAAPTSGTRIECVKGEAGSPEFCFRLLESGKGVVESSSDLSDWDPVLDLSQAPLPALARDGLEFRGDGFRTDAVLKPGPASTSKFLRVSVAE